MGRQHANKEYSQNLVFKSINNVANSSRPLLATHPGGAVQQLDALFDRACELGASDVHFESGAESFRVRLRIDGHLQVVARPPMAVRDAMV